MEARATVAGHRTTPQAAYDARTKAWPSGSPIRNAGEFRIRHDRVDQTGKVTFRYAGKLRHLGIGRAHKGRDVRVLTSEGQLIVELHLDPDRTYQPHN